MTELKDYLKSCNKLIKANWIYFVFPILFSVLSLVVVSKSNKNAIISTSLLVAQFVIVTIIYSNFVSQIRSKPIVTNYTILKRYLFKNIAVFAILYSVVGLFALLKLKSNIHIGFLQTAYIFCVEIIKPFVISLIFFDAKVANSFTQTFNFLRKNFKFNLPIIMAILVLPILQYSVNMVLISYSSEILIKTVNYLFSILNLTFEVYIFIFISIIINVKLFSEKKL